MYIHGSYMSEVLNRKKNYAAILPNHSNEKTRVLFLLHGIQTDELEWSGNTPLTEWAEVFNIAFFCPSAENSFYTDHADGENYGEAIGKEFYEVMRHFFSLDFSRENTAIAGFSMGGYGAIRLGLVYSELYSRIGGFSPAFVFYKKERNEASFSLVFSKGAEESENDCLFLYKCLLNQGIQPAPIRLACGADDPLDHYTQAFCKGVLEIDGQADISYYQQSGFHDFSLWRNDLLRFIKEWSPNIEK